MEETMKRQIPKTDSIDELARFWDTHDLTDSLDELAEVSSPVFERSAVVPVPLTSMEHDALKKLAGIEGVDESALIHTWIKERLHQS